MTILQQYSLSIMTEKRGLVNITDHVSPLIEKSNVTTGLCHLFLHHTSASLTLAENADPLVLRDMEAFISRLIPDGDPLFLHTDEGPDDMPAHVRTFLTQSFLVIPVTRKKLALGQWQGIYLWEHRLLPHHRHLTVTIQGV